MLSLRAKRSLISATILSLLVVFALPTISFGQGRRGRGQEKRYERHDDRDYRQYKRNGKKSRKFINGHDARDGRWDGRGPHRRRNHDRLDRDDYRYRTRERRKDDNYYRNRRYSRTDDRYEDNSNGGAKEILGGILGSIIGGQ